MIFSQNTFQAEITYLNQCLINIRTYSEQYDEIDTYASLLTEVLSLLNIAEMHDRAGRNAQAKKSLEEALTLIEETHSLIHVGETLAH